MAKRRQAKSSQLSLRRILLFFFPSLAIAFLVSSRWQLANQQVARLQKLSSHPDLTIQFNDQAIWSQTFWGRNSLSSIRELEIQFSPDACAKSAILTGIDRLKVLNWADNMSLNLLGDFVQRHPRVGEISIESPVPSEFYALASERWNVRNLTIGTPHVSEADIECWSGTQLQKLTISKGQTLSNDVCSYFAKMGQLQELRTDGIDVNDEGLAELGDLQRLSWLSIRNGQIQGNTLTELAESKKLRHLDLAHNPLRAESARGFLRLTNLQTLDLSGTLIGEEIGPCIQEMRKLTKLLLNQTQATDALCVDIGTLSRLTELGLAKSNITDHGLRNLGPLSKLESLDVRLTRTSIDALREFKTAVTGKSSRTLAIDWQSTPVINRNTGEILSFLPGKTMTKRGEYSLLSDTSESTAFLFSPRINQSVVPLPLDVAAAIAVELAGESERVLFSNGKQVHSLGLARQTPTWTQATPSLGDLTAIDNRLIGVAGYNIRGLNLQDGKPVWKAKLMLPNVAGRGWKTAYRRVTTRRCKDNVALWNEDGFQVLSPSGRTTAYLDLRSPELNPSCKLLAVGVTSEQNVIYGLLDTKSPQVKFHRYPSDEVVSKIQLQSRRDTVAMSPDASTVVTFHRPENKLTLWDLASGQPRAELELAATGEIRFDDERQQILPIIRHGEVFK